MVCTRIQREAIHCVLQGNLEATNGAVQENPGSDKEDLDYNPSQRQRTIFLPVSYTKMNNKIITRFYPLNVGQFYPKSTKCHRKT